MSLRTLMVVALALVFGGSAALGVHSFVQNTQKVRPAPETAPVVVAVTDIPRGGMITPELVRTRDYPKDMVPPGALTTVQDALDRSLFIPLVRNEPVLDVKLSPKGAGRGMASQIPQGMRAFTIHTPSVASGVAGFILPGNRVDVLLTMDSKGGAMTTTLLQNLEILAVDQRIEAPAENKIDSNQLRSVTLLVTPDQAAKLDLGQNRGTLHLSLRNLKDDQSVDARPARLAELDGYQEPQVKPVEESPKPAALPPPAPKVAPPAPKFVIIYRGPPGPRDRPETLEIAGVPNQEDEFRPDGRGSEPLISRPHPE